MTKLPSFIEELNQDDFYYELPEEKIAKFPLKERDQSKLLFYSKGALEHHTFQDLPSLLPPNSLLFFNNTKVIPARLFFRKSTGAYIEIFLLHPVAPSAILPVIMQEPSECTWNCMVGNLKRWKEGTDLKMEIATDHGKVTLTASIADRENMLVTFKWDKSVKFIDVLKAFGEIPLPPYIDRKVEQEDHERYQTVYSHKEGAVAAPTAGLHFTNHTLEEIKKKGNIIDYLTLHVSAGTFQPIKSKKISEHNMHTEQVLVSRKNIENILSNLSQVIAVGTTSLRTLESLYWFGVQLLKSGDTTFNIEKLYPYYFKEEELPTAQQSLTAILQHIDKEGMDEIVGETKIFIVPGYKFRICKGLVTNFHLPGSTLILLIAAFTGRDWKQVYEQALQNDYRFLSYGDSSLLLQ